MMALFGCFPLLYVVIGVMIFSGAMGAGNPNDPPPEVGLLFVAFGAAFSMFGMVCSVFWFDPTRASREGKVDGRHRGLDVRNYGGNMATLHIRNLPDNLYRKLKARAKREHRSVAQELTVLLTAALDAETPLSILQLQGLGKELWRDIDAEAHIAQERATWR